MVEKQWDILEKVKPMLTGEELSNAMRVTPPYDANIRNATPAQRLMELNNLYSYYLPSTMGSEIYTKLYLAMVRSLGKKESKLAIMQRNHNGRQIKGIEPSYGGIIGGSDCFSIIGASGIGKSRSIERAINVIGGEQVIELENPYCKVIPIISVQCPFDCSAKALLLSICKQVDEMLDTNYYEMQIRSRAATNIMIHSVSQILLNHCAVLIIDEIQNLVKHRAGMQLVGLLTELLNDSGVSIVMVGTPEVESFFSSVDYLARRTIGLHYDKCAYDEYFFEFCKELWKFMYVGKVNEITDGVIHFLYEHTSGVLSHVVYLFHTAQEICILESKDSITLDVLEEAYQRMRMLHSHIEPSVSVKKASKRKNISSKAIVEEQIMPIEEGTKEETHLQLDDSIVEHPSSLDITKEWSFLDISHQAKKKEVDMVSLLCGCITLTELVG